MMSETDRAKELPAQDAPAVKPANQRAMARLSAVQALYQMDVGGLGLSQVIAEFEAHRLGKEIDDEQYRPSDAGWFRKLVGGVVEHQRELDPLIHNALVEGWPLKRIEITLRAILRTGSYELLHRRDVPARVVINEYVEVAKGFFDDDEPRIVNGILDRLAREHRADEFSGQ